MSFRQLKDKFHVSVGSISNIIKRKNEYMDDYECNKNKKMKRKSTINITQETPSASLKIVFQIELAEIYLEHYWSELEHLRERITAGKTRISCQDNLRTFFNYSALLKIKCLPWYLWKLQFKSWYELTWRTGLTVRSNELELHIQLFDSVHLNSWPWAVISLFMTLKEFHIIPIQVIRYLESLCAKYSKVELDFFNI